MPVEGKTVGILVGPGYEDLEFWVPYMRMQEEGAEVKVIGTKDDMVNAGATWVDEPAFREGNLMWGRVVADIPDYCRELIRALG
jgi:putative intracellular protease/amidase